jgi:hypothetical protein
MLTVLGGYYEGGGRKDTYLGMGVGVVETYMGGILILRVREEVGSRSILRCS